MSAKVLSTSFFTLISPMFSPPVFFMIMCITMVHVAHAVTIFSFHHVIVELKIANGDTGKCFDKQFSPANFSTIVS